MKQRIIDRLFARPEHRILFLCTANVCRSPLAEALLRHRLCARGMQRRITVASAGTRVGQPGRRPDPRILQLCTAAGVSMRGIRARPVDLRSLDNADTVLVMQQEHIEDLVAHNVPERLLDRVQLLGRYLLPAPAAAGVDIPDPYFADREGLVAVYEQIDLAVGNLLEAVVESGFPAT